MVYSKIKKICFILLCCIVIIFPFWCVRGLCAELEEVEVISINGISVNPNRNYFGTASQNLGYFQMEMGYVYHVFFTGSATTPRNLAVSSELPVLNGTYTFLTTLNNGETYDYIPVSSQYLYFSYYQQYEGVTVTREKLQGQQSAVNDLVENVGTGNLWSIFEIAIDYIWVVVLVAFGIFIITRIIKKLSKSKGGM